MSSQEVDLDMSEHLIGTLNPIAAGDPESASGTIKRDSESSSVEITRDAEDAEFDDTKPSRFVTMCAMIASINSANLGYDQGVSTGLVHTFQRESGDGLRFSNVQIELFVGMLSFSAMAGAATMSYLSDKYGRRFIFLLSQVVFIVGIVTMIAAPNYGVIMFGRFITGFGIGLGLASDPMYIAEVAPSKIRGRLVSWSETADNVGILLGFVSSWVFSGANGNTQWRAMLSLGLIMPVLLLVLVTWWMPESPRWLLQQGRTEEAAEILRKASSNPRAKGEKLAAALQADIDEEHSQAANTTWMSMLQDAVARRKLRAGLGMAIAQQITGEEAILYYMIIILNDAGINSSDKVYSSLICVGLAKVAAIIFAGILFDYYGRRVLLQASNAGIAISLFLLAAVSYEAPVAGFVALVLYVVAFSSGMGPGAWLIPSEVFSNDIRAKGLSLCTVSNRAAALVVTSTFLSLKSVMTPAGVFVMYGFIAIAVIAYVRAYVPETKGRNLETVHKLFSEDT